MKLFIFNIKNTNKIYAFTNKKEYKNKFKLERNMDLFDEYSLNIDKNTFNKLEKDNPELFSLLLKNEKLITKTNKNKKITKLVLSNSKELDDIKFNTELTVIKVLIDMMNDGLIMQLDLSIFKNKYKDILENLFYYSDIFAIANGYDDVPWDHFIYDQFSLFCKLFGYTLYKNYKEFNDDYLEIL